MRPNATHPDLTQRVRLVMAWNRFVFYHPPLPTWLGWNLIIRKPGCVLRKDRRP